MSTSGSNSDTAAGFYLTACPSMPTTHWVAQNVAIRVSIVTIVTHHFLRKIKTCIGWGELANPNAKSMSYSPKTGQTRTIVQAAVCSPVAASRVGRTARAARTLARKIETDESVAATPWAA
jgi:hypothetical protein